MKTQVIMKRELFGSEISQESKRGFFSATDLFRAGNQWRSANGLHYIKITDWLAQKGNKEFIKTLGEETGEDVKITARGRSKHTWVHPFLFLDMALSINPKLKVKVYRWLYDELIKYRNKSGDSYKKMAGALYLTISNKSKFQSTIQWVAERIKKECEVNDWQTASEDQLKLRDKIHEYISIFADIVRDYESLIDVSIEKARNTIKNREGK